MREPKDIMIGNRTLEEILIDHEHWVNEDCDNWRNMCADLSDINLHDVDLHCADLQNVKLSNANLNGADLSGAYLANASLYRAKLDHANLYAADLTKANLSGAFLANANLSNACLLNARLCDTYLIGANLDNADLRDADLIHAHMQHSCLNADLGGANLRSADLCDAILDNAILTNANLQGTMLYNMLYNTKGSLIEYRKGKILTEDIIGYKKCKFNVIVTLLIPRGSIVFSINGHKCRTNRAKVIAIDGADRAYSKYKYMTYYVGDEFNIYDFNLQYNIECAEGIHFFMTRQEAEDY